MSQAALIVFFSIVGTPLPHCSPTAHASPMVVILTDRLSLRNVDDTSDGPLDRYDMTGAVIGLVSPGLPNHKAGGPYANLYATLSAGDVVDSSNQFNGLLQRELYVGISEKDVRIVQFGDASTTANKVRLRNLIHSLRTEPPKGTQAPGILLVGVLPASDANPGTSHETWSDLTPIVWLTCENSGSDSSLLPTFTSDTTQTKGLIALRDIAPTILETEGLPIPPSMSGRPAHVVEFGSNSLLTRDTLLLLMESQTETNQLALAQFGWIFGMIGGAILIWAGVSVSSGGQNGFVSYALQTLLCVPLALLIAPLFGILSPSIYLLAIAVVALICGAMPSVSIILAITCLSILLDAIFWGTTLVSRSLLSGYWLSGIRFYGIGNEFMGILIGMALILPISWHEQLAGQNAVSNDFNSRWSFPALVGLGTWFLCVLIALSYPDFGAKAGGAVVVCASFIPLIHALLRQKSPSACSWLLGVVLGFASIFALALIARHFGARQTHIQDAVTSLTHGKFSDIAHVAVRKAKMAVRIALSPGAASGIIGVVFIVLLTKLTSFGKMLTEFLAAKSNQTYAWAMQSSLWGMLACVLFNDSGIVAALLMFGVIAVCTLHEMLENGRAIIANPGS